MGPPATSPTAGAPAATSDHHPSALTRSVAGVTPMIRAMAAGMVAAPITAAPVRNPMSDSGSQASAARAVTTVATPKPHRNVRR